MILQLIQRQLVKQIGILPLEVQQLPLMVALQQEGTADDPTRNEAASATISTGTFTSVISAEGLTFDQDLTEGFVIPTGSGNGRYNYNPQAFVITPIPGKIIVIKTRNGNYAKMEILSYYQNQHDTPDPFTDLSRYYSFNYLYNPNVGEFSLE